MADLDQVAARLAAERAGTDAKAQLGDVKRAELVAEAQGLTAEGAGALPAITPESLVQPLSLLFGKITNPLVAKLAGEELRLTPAEVRELAEAWAPAAALYGPNVMQWLTHPLAIGIGGTLAIYGAKVEAAEATRAAAQASRPDGRPVEAPPAG
jgi:hypothetical protein